MTCHIDAIYDNGVLKPLEPLILPDQSRVKVTVESAETNSAIVIDDCRRRGAWQCVC
jgi:predicted DNA-binding antitoxin AbrB/MazE fold protein